MLEEERKKRLAERKVQRKEERRAKWLKEREEEEERKREEEQKLLEEEARKKQEEEEQKKKILKEMEAEEYRWVTVVCKYWRFCILFKVLCNFSFSLSPHSYLHHSTVFLSESPFVNNSASSYEPCQ